MDPQPTPLQRLVATARALAAATRTARSTVVKAIDSLTARGYLTTRQGSATRAATYQVNPLLTTFVGGLLAGPPPSTSRTTLVRTKPPQLIPHTLDVTPALQRSLPAPPRQQLLLPQELRLLARLPSRVWRRSRRVNPKP